MAKYKDLVVALTNSKPGAVWKLGRAFFVHFECLQDDRVWRRVKAKHRKTSRLIHDYDGITVEKEIVTQIEVFPSYDKFKERAKDDVAYSMRLFAKCACGFLLCNHARPP